MVKLPKLPMNKPKMKVELTNNRLIAALMTATTLVVAISVVLSKTWLGDIGFNNKVISRKNAVKDTLEQNVKATPQLQENFKYLQDNGPAVFNILQALPISPDYPGLSAELEAAAALANVQLLSLTPQLTGGEAPAASTSGIPAPQEVIFQATASGSYASLQQFLGNLERSRRPIRISLMTFSGTDPELNFTATFTTYWQPISQIGDEKETISEN